MVSVDTRDVHFKPQNMSGSVWTHVKKEAPGRSISALFWISNP